MVKSRHTSVRSGFTLIELLVAIAVLAIIVVAASQILGTASSLTTVNNKHIDADGQARMVFDRMANDFARMVKRNDVDYIFCKAPINDTMYFYTEGASYFNASGSIGFPIANKNSVSVVGYRIDNGSNGLSIKGTAPYGQMERLGRSLSWDNHGTSGGIIYLPQVFLTYPPAGKSPLTTTPADAVTYSTAMYNSTLLGAYITSSSSNDATPLVGTLAKNFNNSEDVTYDPIGTNVFRFEFSFQLKDGTQAAIPVMTPSTNNGIPSANLTAATPPTFATDSTVTAAISNTSTKYAVGSRWYDTTRHIGYICIDATPGYAIWHEIGIQDIAAIVVTIAVIDKQGLTYVNKAKIDPIVTLAAQFADGTDASVAQTWTAAITPASAGASSAVASVTKIPQSMVSQIRIYQRFFYINNF